MASSKRYNRTPPLQLLRKRVVRTLAPNIKVNNIERAFRRLLLVVVVLLLIYLHSVGWEVLLKVPAARCSSNRAVPECMWAPTKAVVAVDCLFCCCFRNSKAFSRRAKERLPTVRASALCIHGKREAHVRKREL